MTPRARRTPTAKAEPASPPATTPVTRRPAREAIQTTAEKPSTAKRAVGRPRKTPLPAEKTAGEKKTSPAAKTTAKKKAAAKAKELAAAPRRSTRASLARSSLA